MMMRAPLIEGDRTTYFFQPKYRRHDFVIMAALLKDATAMGFAALRLIDDSEIKVVITGARS